MILGQILLFHVIVIYESTGVSEAVVWHSILIFCSIVRILDCGSEALGPNPCMTLGKSLSFFGPYFLHL